MVHWHMHGYSGCRRLFLKLMHTFNGDLPSWRFGEVVVCASQLLERETALKIFWHPDKMLRGGPSRRRQNGPADPADREAQKCTNIIGNDLWWAFTKLVLLLQSALDKFANWMEGCECHPDRVFDESGEGNNNNRLTKRRRRAQFKAESKGAGTTCPMKGCRAHELADRAHNRILAEVLSTTHADVVMLAASLPVDAKDILLSNWARGRAYLLYITQLKLSCFSVVPLRLACIGLRDLERARAGLRACFQQYNARHDADHHRLTRHVFGPDSPILPEVFTFLDGGGLGPKLDALRTTLRNIPIVERSIERQHRMVSSEMSHVTNYTPQYLSCGLRNNEVESRLRADPGFLSELAAKCSLVQNPREAAIKLSFAGHRLLQAVDPDARFAYARLLHLLVYRCDPRAQYEFFPHVKKILTSFNKTVGAAQSASGSIELGSAESLFAKYALEHFQNVVADSNNFYSLARTVAMDTLEHRLTTVAPRPQQRAFESLAPIFEADGDDFGGAAMLEGGQGTGSDGDAQNEMETSAGAESARASWG